MFLDAYGHSDLELGFIRYISVADAMENTLRDPISDYTLPQEQVSQAIF
jgi:hypothetical protein